MSGGITPDDVPAVILARLEGKVDLINAKLNDHAYRMQDHEDRLRKLEQRPSLDVDAESRIRLLEQRPAGITAKAFIPVIGVAAAVVATVTPLLERLYGA